MWAYVINLAVLISINAILAVTLNFILGYAGIFSIAHALFFGVGAYTATFFAMKFGAGFLPATAAGMALAALISLALALPALRVRGEYFVAASLGLQMLAITVFTEWKSVTGGIGGLTNIPPARIFGFAVTQPEHFLLLSLICLALIIFDHPRPGALELRPQPEGHSRRRDGRLGLRQERGRHQDHGGGGVIGAGGGGRLALCLLSELHQCRELRARYLHPTDGDGDHRRHGDAVGAGDRHRSDPAAAGGLELLAVSARHRDRLDPADRLRPGDGRC